MVRMECGGPRALQLTHTCSHGAGGSGSEHTTEGEVPGLLMGGHGMRANSSNQIGWIAMAFTGWEG